MTNVRKVELLKKRFDMKLVDIQELNRSAWQLRWTDPKRALEIGVCIEDLLNEARLNSSTSKQDLAYCLRTQAWVNRWFGHYELAGQQALRGLPIMQSLGDTENQALLMKLIGDHTNYEFQDFTVVANWYYDALNLLPDNRFPETKVAILLHIGMLQIDMNIHQEAQFHFGEALMVAQEQNDTISESRVRLNYAELHRQSGDFQRGLSELEIANNLANEANAHLLTNYILTHQGRIYFDLEKYADAKLALGNALDGAENLGDRKALGLINHAFGEIYFREKQYDLALTHAQKAKARPEAISNVGTRAKIDKLLYQIYKSRGDLEKALGHFEMHNTIREAQLNGNTQRIVQEMQARHIVELARQEADMVRTRNAALQKEVADRILAEEALKAAKEDAVQAQEKAEQANRAKGNFLAHMSHEIRTPMNGVLGMTELLLATPLIDEQQDMLSTIRKSGNALLAVVNDILDFAKVEGGKVELDKQPFDVVQCLLDIIRIMEPVAAKKRIKLALSKPSTDPLLIVSDELRLTQILNNLIGNAIKFTHTGTVTVDLNHRQIAPGEYELEFNITDTGIGMTEDARAHIFEPFKQADNSTTRRYGGTGLGLALSKQLVELFGGRIWVNSQAGEGSTFSFTIPVEQAHLTGHHSQHRKAVPAIKVSANEFPLQILIAEDNPVNQKVLLRSLARLGYEPTLTNNGAEAVDEALRLSYDLVLMDIHMPVMDGLTASKKIRDEISPSKQPVIVAVTASVLTEERNRANAAGINRFLAKPFKQDEVSTLLKDVFEMRTLTNEERADAANPGYQNSGYQNSGYQNSGYQNPGYQNSQD